MTQPTHLFVPCLGTEKDESLLRVACQIAKLHSTRLTVANIIKVPMAYRVDGEDVPGLDKANISMDKAEAIASDFGLVISTDVLAARDTAAAIVAAATNAGADVIFMEADPSSTHSPEAMGSTVESVLQKASCQVWVSRMVHD